MCCRPCVHVWACERPEPSRKSLYVLAPHPCCCCSAVEFMGGSTAHFRKPPPPVSTPLSRPRSAPSTGRRKVARRSVARRGSPPLPTRTTEAPTNGATATTRAAARSTGPTAPPASVVGRATADASAVRNTLFWRGGARHGVDPRLLRAMGPGPDVAPSIKLTKCVCAHELWGGRLCVGVVGAGGLCCAHTLCRRRGGSGRCGCV